MQAKSERSFTKSLINAHIYGGGSIKLKKVQPSTSVIQSSLELFSASRAYTACAVIRIVHNGGMRNNKTTNGTETTMKSFWGNLVDVVDNFNYAGNKVIITRSKTSGKHSFEIEGSARCIDTMEYKELISAKSAARRTIRKSK